MSKNINVEVNSIRLEESSETPILLLLDPSTQKVLPIWIGTIEAVSIAYAQEGVLHDRPQTHDLLLNMVEALDGTINEVNISNIEENTYFADIILNTINGTVTLSARPSDAIALALRSNIPVTVNQDVFETNSIDLIIDNSNEIEEFKEFIKAIYHHNESINWNYLKQFMTKKQIQINRNQVLNKLNFKSFQYFVIVEKKNFFHLL